jgi:hypothetical protein
MKNVDKRSRNPPTSAAAEKLISGFFLLRLSLSADCVVINNNNNQNKKLKLKHAMGIEGAPYLSRAREERKHHFN